MKKKDFKVKEFKPEFGQEINRQCNYFSYNSEPYNSIRLNYLFTSEANEIILEVSRLLINPITLSISIDNSEPIYLTPFCPEKRFPSSYQDLNIANKYHYYTLSIELVRRICEAKDIYLIFEEDGRRYSTRKSKYYQPGYLIPYFQAFYDSLILSGSYPKSYKKIGGKIDVLGFVYVFQQEKFIPFSRLLENEKLLIALAIGAFLAFILCDIFGFGNLFLVLEVLVAIATIFIIPLLIIKYEDLCFTGVLKAIFGTIGALLGEAVLIDGIIGSVCNFGFVATFL